MTHPENRDEIGATKPVVSQLDHSLVHGVAWTAGVKWATQLVVWLSTLVVVRLLSPADYGVFGMATLYLGLVQLLSEFGIGTAVVTLKSLSHTQIAQLNGAAVILGVGGFLLIAAAAEPLGAFFGSSQLPAVLVVVGIGFVISAFSVVPAALLLRDMQFKHVAFFGGLQALTASAITVVLAWMDYGYWSLVLANLCGVALFTALVTLRRPHAFARPRRDELRGALSLSGSVIGSRLSWYAYTNADFLVIGRVLGQSALGIYTVAWTLATMAVDKITAIIGSVTPSVFSAAQADPATLRRYLLRVTESVAVVTFPICAGLALVAGDAVTVVLGPKWTGAIRPLEALAVFGLVRSIAPFLSQVLTVTGDAFFTMMTGVVAAILFPAAFYVASHWGIDGVALTWMLAYPLLLVPLLLRVMRRIDLHFLEYLRCMWPATSGALALVVTVRGTQTLLAGAVGQSVALIAAVLIGALTYFAVMWSLHRTRFQNLRALLRQSSPPAPAAAVPTS